MTQVAFRVNGGQKIGLGHIQRCLALAKVLKTKKGGLFFVCKKEKYIRNMVKENRIDLVEISGTVNLKEDLKETINFLKDKRINILVTDSYRINENYLKDIKKETSVLLVSIDDFAKFSFASDIIINQNAYAKKLDYKSSTGKTKFLLGPKYALLREGFTGLPPRRLNRKVKNILITFGGMDLLNLTPRVLRDLDRIDEDFSITVLVGPSYRNIKEIEKVNEKISKKVNVVYDCYEVAELMLGSDIAISGGGTTLYELAATGTPAISLCLSDNQKRNVKAMAEKGVVIGLEGLDTINENVLSQKIKELMRNYELRKKMSYLGQRLVDGNGPFRASKVILEELSKVPKTRCLKK